MSVAPQLIEKSASLEELWELLHSSLRTVPRAHLASLERRGVLNGVERCGQISN